MKRGSSFSTEPFGSSKRAAGASTGGAAEEDRRAAFLGALTALNTQFAAWVQQAVATNPDAPLLDAGHEYIAYLASLEDKYLRPDGEVFTFGSGECGQLAHGVEEDEDLSVRKPRIVTSLRDKQVRVVACGGIHSVAVGADGRVWSWGCNDDGALGRATGPIDPEDMSKGMKGDENFPALVTLGTGGEASRERVVHVACGDSQTLALTVDGNVWGWGCYKDKEGRKWFDLPKGYSGKADFVKRQQDEPMKLDLLPANMAADLKCGASFNVALLKNGSVLTWGLGEVGDLGRPASAMRDEKTNYRFEAIRDEHLTPQPPIRAGGLGPLPAVKSIGTGMWHLFLVTAVGSEVYTSGLNNYGQLGLGDETNRDHLEPIPALAGRGVTVVGGGQHHSIALAGGGVVEGVAATAPAAVFAWGRADYGQLGVGNAVDSSPGSFLNQPVETALPADSGAPTQLSCGENHTLLLTAKRQVFSWGFGEMGQLGHFTDKDELAPKRLDLARAKLDHLQVLMVAGGGQHSIFLGRHVD